MNAHFISSSLHQEFIASSLLGVLIVMAALAVLRSKHSVHHSVLPLQYMCLGALLLVLSNSAFLLELIDDRLLGILEVFALGPWLAACLKLTDTAYNQNRQSPLKLVSFWLWSLSLFGVFAVSLNPSSVLPLQLQPVKTLLPALGPVVLIGTLSLMGLSRTRVARLPGVATMLLASSLFALCYLALSVLAIANSYQSAPVLPDVLLPTTSPLQPRPGFASYLNIASAVLVPLLMLAGAVLLRPRMKLSLSRKIILYSLVLLAGALFTLILALVGTYANRYSDPGSTVLQFGIIVATCLALGYVALSTNLRSSIWVSIDKHFFQHKYDYRNVWQNLIQTLSHVSDDEDFFLLGLKAVGEIFEARGGALWLANDEEKLSLEADWNIDAELASQVAASESFLEPFIKEDWIYALNASGQQEHDRHLRRLPEWLAAIENIWVIAPLMVGRNLVGFFILLRDEHNESLNWEDIDVLKSTGRQLASYIVRQRSAEQLAQSRQFDTYNKLTAFIMHDLKNLIAQQALVVENAQKHKENPAFVEDAIRTIDNSVTRMNQLLKRLQRSSHQSVQRSVSVRDIITEAIRKSADRQPIPTLRGQSEDAYVVADREQIVMILLHVIRNAQDATRNDGFIDIDVSLERQTVMIDVEDNGCGMDEDFINNRLFKPFDSTKSSMGMGIGAYQVREFIEAMGGKLQISSQIDMGTTVCIQLPVAYNESKMSVAK